MKIWRYKSKVVPIIKICQINRRFHFLWFLVKTLNFNISLEFNPKFVYFKLQKIENSYHRR